MQIVFMGISNLNMAGKLSILAAGLLVPTFFLFSFFLDTKSYVIDFVNSEINGVQYL